MKKYIMKPTILALLKLFTLSNLDETELSKINDRKDIKRGY